MWAHPEQHPFEQSAARSRSVFSWTATRRKEQMQRQWNVQVSVIAFQTKALAANMKESIRSRRPPHRACPKNKSRLIPIDSLQSITKIQCQREASQKQNVQSSKAMTRDRVKKGFVNNLWSRGDAWQLKSTNLRYNLEMPRRDKGFF